MCSWKGGLAPPSFILPASEFLMLDHALRVIGDLPRVTLHAWPTPFMPMEGLTRTLRAQTPGAPTLWVKREDLTSLGAGGNKVRKLEFVLGKAVAEGCDMLLNTGEVQSNQVVQTAAAAARAGLPCELFLGRTNPPLSEDDEVTGNMLLNRLLGATIHMVPQSAGSASKAMEARAAELKAQGRKPHVIARGASTPEGDAGAVLGLLELLSQATEARVPVSGIVVSVGSAGTCAGFLVALTLLARSGRPAIPLYAFDTFGPDYPQPAHARIMGHAEACWQRLGLPGTCGDELLRLDTDSVGPGYCRPYPEMLEAIRLTAASEGIILDPNYTGKTVAGLIRRIRAGQFSANDNLVYLHSGGLPALFAMRRIFD